MFLFVFFIYLNINNIIVKYFLKNFIKLYYLNFYKILGNFLNFWDLHKVSLNFLKLHKILLKFKKFHIAMKILRNFLYESLYILINLD